MVQQHLRPLFTLATSNTEKVHFATIALHKENIPFDTASISVVEIQSDDPQELIEHKAKSAFEILQRPVVVNDHWWAIEALGGFPGPYMKFVNEHMQPEHLLRALEGISNRTITFTECICYFDGNNIQSFFDQVEGVVLSKPQGKGNPGQQVVSLSGDGLSIADHLNAGTDPRQGKPRKVWIDLAAWIRAKR